MQRLKSDLFDWYAAEMAAGRSHTRVQQLLPGMFGAPGDRKFALHASETNAFLRFSVTLLDRFGHLLGDRAGPFRDGVRSLLRLVDSIELYPRKFPAPVLQSFVEDVCLHLRCVRRLELGFKPKHHLMVEMAARLTDLKITDTHSFFHRAT